MTLHTVAVINSAGRQAASFIRVASAVGWNVRAQVLGPVTIVAEEIRALPNVTILNGSLEDPDLVDELFQGADLAFINTTHWGDEVAIGCRLADAAKKACVKHYIYSSMPDHSAWGYEPLPLWASKAAIEKHIRAIQLPATYLYTGIYHNNFTSLPYPVFRMVLHEDDTWSWTAPFDPEVPLPWLDAEHDVGPAVLQIFKSPQEWIGKRIPLAFDILTPLQVCRRFSRGLGRPVRYIQGPLEVEVKVPDGYTRQLEMMAETLGERQAPYFGPDMEIQCPDIARSLWGGYRGIEEYAREVFPVEEEANGLKWMREGDSEDEVELDFPNLRRIKVPPPPPSIQKVCSDPVSRLHQQQIAALDPNGFRTRLFHPDNPECAKVGDILLVRQKTGDPFAGVLLSIRKRGVETGILLRNQLTRVGVEMWYKIYSPNVDGIEVVQRRKKRARRARLYYMRKPKHDLGSVEPIVKQYLRQRAVLGMRGAGPGGVKGRGANAAKKASLNKTGFK
ncbi:NmrA-domain-containing protein [Aulographum hederae CBS 113979]|uniref:NmrA-domain-containing protein n=1 Tax=Aulographum hederae CBS 113979 TaxID=1176131 RepID=A0A6G1H0E1_9PEZI|nr:NmrA-domain-containing protein [Aulographum hederae CBS 113979]